MGMNSRLLRPLATGFNPKSISGLLAWYDASDAASVTLNGSNISQLTDKSGNSRNATQSTFVQQPASVAAVQNGRSICRFNGTSRNDELVVSIPMTSAVTLFWLGTPTTGKNDTYLVCGSGSGGKPSLISRYLLGSPSVRRDYAYFGGGGDVAVIATSASGFSVVAYTLVDGGSTIGYINGTQTVTYTQSGTMSGLNIIRLGSTGSSAYANADLGEFLVWNRVLSTAERQRVERYLGRKWNIAVA
jgi:hypothetical protein